MKKADLKRIVREEIEFVLREFIKNDNELEILINAAIDINKQFFQNRGTIDALTYTMTVREPANEVLSSLKRRTEVVKRVKGFSASVDEATEFYQLPDFNVAISFDPYGLARATVIQFLSFKGEKPQPNWK